MRGVDEPRPRPLCVVVLGLNYAPETTGIAPYTTGLARHLAAKHHDVTVVAGHPHYPQWKIFPGYEMPQPPENDAGVRLLRVPHPVPKNPVGASRVWMEIIYAWRAARKLARQRPTVVVSISPALLALIPALALRPVLGHRVGAVVQDLYGAALSETGIGGGLVARLTAWLELALLRRADGVAVIHEVFKARLVGKGLAAEKIIVVPNWVHVTMPPQEERAHARARLRWADHEFVALHAGNMGSKQGLEGLIDVARLADERQAPIRIVLLGHGSQRSTLVRYAKGTQRVTFMESLPEGEFELALAAADCLLLHERPGVLEMSVPSKLTTYFAAGRPVIAATHPSSGAAAIMHEAQAGLRVDAGDASAILRAIENLRADSDAAARYAESGRDYAEMSLAGAASLLRTEAWLRQLTE